MIPGRCPKCFCKVRQREPTLCPDCHAARVAEIEARKAIPPGCPPLAAIPGPPVTADVGVPGTMHGTGGGRRVVRKGEPMS